MSTNWKDIGKNSGNMSQYRNVTHQKLSYENGNLNTIYDISGIKTKGYIFDISGENIVLGVGTDKPFSRLSLGNNADSGVFNPQKPGQLAAIALDESDTGNGFSGIVLNSKIKTLNNLETKGLQLISSQNNFSMDDSTMGRIILSNENVTTIGGNSRKNPGGYSDSTAGMNIVLDVRGSIRTDGYINFFDKPSDDTNQKTSPNNVTWTEQFDKIPPGSLFLKENKDSISDEGLYFKNSSGVEIQVAGGGGGGGGGVGTSSSVFDVSSQGVFTFIAANGTGDLGRFGGHPVTFSGESHALPTDPATSYFNNAVTIKEGNLAVITEDGKLLKVGNPDSDLTYFSKPGGIILAEKQLLIGKTASNSDRFGYGLIDIQSVETVPSMLCTNNSSIPFEPTAATNSIMLLTRETVSPSRTTGDIGQTYDCSNTIIIGSANFLNIDTPNSIISINPYLESRGDGSKIVDISGSNLIFGANNDLSASPFSIIFGTGNEIDSTNKTVDSPEGKENVALGTNNRLFNSQNSFVQGTNNVNYGNLNVIFGKQNKIGNEEGTWNGGKESDHFQYSGSNCFIQGNNNIIKAPYDISVNNAFIAGYGNILDCSGSSFVKNPEASYVLLGSKARIDQSDFTNDSSNVRFAFGTRESNRNVFTIDKDGNVVIEGNLLIKGTKQTKITDISSITVSVVSNNLSLNVGPYTLPEGAAEGGGITLMDTVGGRGDKGLIWNSSPSVHGSENYWHTKGSDISTNDLFANSIIANDISGNDASFNDLSLNYLYVNGNIKANDISANNVSFNDLSLNYLYVNGNIKADALHLTPSTGLRTGGAPGSIILGDLTSGTAGGEYSVSAGQNNTSGGNYSVAMGQYNTSSGNYSVALGNRAYAGDNIRFAIGISDTASTALATSGSGNNNKFVIDVSGNVGIGTDTPTEKLEVDGNIKSQGLKVVGTIKMTDITINDHLPLFVANEMSDISDNGSYAKKWYNNIPDSPDYLYLETISTDTTYLYEHPRPLTKNLWFGLFSYLARYPVYGARPFKLKNGNSPHKFTKKVDIYYVKQYKHAYVVATSYKSKSTPEYVATVSPYIYHDHIYPNTTTFYADFFDGSGTTSEVQIYGGGNYYLEVENADVKYIGKYGKGTSDLSGSSTTGTMYLNGSKINTAAEYQAQSYSGITGGVSRKTVVSVIGADLSNWDTFCLCSNPNSYIYYDILIVDHEEEKKQGNTREYYENYLAAKHSIFSDMTDDGTNPRMTASAGLRTGGTGSIILGDLTSGTAVGIYSVSAGKNNTSGGNYSVAMGQANTSTGNYSVAMGQYNTSSGNYSVALGNRAYAGDNIRFAIGISDTASTALTTSGSGNNNKFVIDVSGNVGIGTDTPTYKLDVNGDIKVRDIDFYHSPKWTENTSTDVAKNWTRITSSSDGTKLAAVVWGENIWTSVDSGEKWDENKTTGDGKNWYDITSSSDGKNLAATVSGGKIWTSDDYGASWTPRGDTNNWETITSSSDGTKLAAVVDSGNIWTSDDAGESWTPRGQNRNWYGITSSSDGTKLAACVYGGNIWTSVDAGETWTDRGYTKRWQAITSSSDGTKLAAVVSNGQIWTSVDSGATWTPRGDVAKNWLGITSSSDGTKLAVCVYDGNIWTSVNSGLSWTENTSIGVKYWQGITSSSDGTKLAACPTYNGKIWTFNTEQATEQAGSIYTSSDDGNSKLNFTVSKNNSVTMILDSGGNVGIGTDTPGSGYKLDVSGNIKADALHLTPSAGLRTGTGVGSIILGHLTEGAAGGEYSVSAGKNNTSTGNYSVAMGQDNTSTGNYSVALGNRAYAGDNIRFAIGISDTASTALATSGSGNNNKFVIDVSGNVGIGNNIVPSSWKLQVDGNIKANQLFLTSTVLRPGTGAGSIILGHSTMGTAGGNYSVSAGYNNNTSGGNFSVAMGYNNTSAGEASVAMGNYNTSTNRNSVAMGNSNTSEGESSVAMGESNTSTGEASVAMGRFNHASYKHSVALGNRAWTGDNIRFAIGISDTQVDALAYSGNNNNKFVIDVNGNVGIRADTPYYPLHVSGSNRRYGSSDWNNYYIAAQGYSYLLGPRVNDYDYENTSIYCTDAVWCNRLVVSSDKRIKTNIRDVSDNVALQQLRDISCCFYEYKDKINKGFGTTIGFIAQQVKEKMPMAVGMQVGIIPNEMRNLENLNWETITDESGNETFKLTIDDLSVNQLEYISGNTKYKFYVSNDPSENETEKEILSMENDPKSFIFEKKWENIFLYGKEVDDFHTIDKSKIFAMAFSATQEIDRIQQKEKIKLEAAEVKLEEQTTKLGAAEVKISTLESENTTLKDKVAILKDRLDAIEARLTNGNL